MKVFRIIPKKVSLKMLNSADINSADKDSFSDLVLVYLMVFVYLTCLFNLEF